MKIIQANLDKGREANCLLRTSEEEGAEVVVIQELYR